MNRFSHEVELRALLSKFSDCDLSAVELETDLVHELGLDSLAGLRMLAAVEKRFNVRFPDEKLSELRTLKQLLDVVDQKGKER